VVSDTCERHFLPLSQGWERGLGGEGDSKPPYLVTHLDRAGWAMPTQRAFHDFLGSFDTGFRITPYSFLLPSTLCLLPSDAD
ncbi:hypothetical protein PN462_15470, partial [Spirulina sp. CS-785/01]|uniref:hypothetical protein n=1 Tax=Spirulina sp. CS-785/01 TaxID=3021716 RepID=UPI00232E8CDF